MITLQETTKSFSENILHTYIVNDDKSRLIAYIKRGTTEVITFSKPLKFCTKGRTFKTIK